jgi:hypothetical protein
MTIIAAVNVALLLVVSLGFAGLIYVLNSHLEEMHEEISAARQLSLLRNIADEIQTTRIALSGALGAINRTAATTNARLEAKVAEARGGPR